MKNNLLIDGQWSKDVDPSKYSPNSRKNFRNLITSNGSSQFAPEKVGIIFMFPMLAHGLIERSL